jgi:L-asparaginase
VAIRIFVTGGTFDKKYNELTGSLEFEDTHLGEMLQLGRCRLDVDVRTLMMIDSLDMTDTDRQIIVDNCKRSEEAQIVVTHGTDTMVETAEALAAAVPGKTIVLTGAMVPYAFGSSDGLFNLGSALSFVQVLPPGVYIAMNGRCFTWDNVRKTRAFLSRCGRQASKYRLASQSIRFCLAHASCSRFRLAASQHLATARAHDLGDACFIDHELRNQRSATHGEPGFREWNQDSLVVCVELLCQHLFSEVDPHTQIGPVHLPGDVFVFAHISLEHGPWNRDRLWFGWQHNAGPFAREPELHVCAVAEDDGDTA